MITKELLKLLQHKYGCDSFTGNQLVNELRLNNNQIHLQLYNISRKTDLLVRYSKDKQIYYYLK
jgi:hypothetical protein